MDSAPIAALDIGTTKIRAVVAEPREDDHLAVLGVGECAARGVRKSEVIDLDAVMPCIRTALHNAEQMSNVTIRQVNLVVSGGHIQSMVNRGSIPLQGVSEIVSEDVDHVMEAARAVNLSEDREVLHTICQHFLIDDQQYVVNPIGMEGAKLAVEMLILHGIRTRLRNLVKAARSVPVDVADAAFSGLCAALAVLSPEEKKNGTAVIDLGGGSTSYVAYADGAIERAGCLGVGGDHITNDLARGLRLSLGQAEELKETVGSAMLDRATRAQKVEIRSEDLVDGVSRHVRIGDVHTITGDRIEETLQLVKSALDPAETLPRLGAGIVLTGGGSYLRGVTELASQVFGLPCVAGRPRDVSGLATATSGPEFATAIGMLRYAQRTSRRIQATRGSVIRIFEKILRKRT